MGWRFRKSLRFGPLLRLNLSKTGTSWSVGKRGLTVNLGRGRAKATVSAPGTGLSYSESMRVGEPEPEGAENAPSEKPKTLGRQLIAGILGGLLRGR